MRIPARDWNAWVQWVLENRLTHLLQLPKDGWRWPWFTSCRWQPSRERFEATVKPGFVNGVDPVTAVERADGEVEDIPLSEEPAIVVSTWRPVPAAPSFFSRFGVATGKDLPDAEGLLETVQLGGPVEVEGLLSEQVQARRQLRAADVVLVQPRPRTEVEWEVAGVDGAAGSVAQFQTRILGSLERPRIRVEQEHRPAELQDLASLIDGVRSDAGEDTRLVARIYLLGPDGVLNPEAPVDGRWVPLPSHGREGLYWNLGYSPPPVQLVADPAELSLNFPIAGGLLQSISNQLLAQVNDAQSAVAQYLNRAVQPGRFWTV